MSTEQNDRYIIRSKTGWIKKIGDEGFALEMADSRRQTIRRK